MRAKYRVHPLVMFTMARAWSASQAMDWLQDRGWVSDNCVSIRDVGPADTERVLRAAGALWVLPGIEPYFTQRHEVTKGDQGNGGVESRHAIEGCSEIPEQTEAASMSLELDLEVTKARRETVEIIGGTTRGGAGEPHEDRMAACVEDSRFSVRPISSPL